MGQGAHSQGKDQQARVRPALHLQVVHPLLAGLRPVQVLVDLEEDNRTHRRW